MGDQRKLGSIKANILYLLLLGSVGAVADISGTVFKDFDFDGVYNTANGDAPLIGAAVKATCDDGNVYTAVTSTSGHYTLSGFPSGSKCRIEVDAATSGYGDAYNASGSSPLVDMVADGATHDVSVGSPATYCQANPDVVMAALPGYFTSGKYGPGGGTSPIGHNFGSIFKVPAPQTGEFNNNGTIGAKRTTLAIIDQTGAIWGAAWQKSTKALFVSAALKRYVPLKDESSASAAQTSAGTIYKVDMTATPPNISPFAVVPNVLSGAAANDMANRDYSYNQDKNTIKYTGRMGLGDLDISEDETKLYTVNMNTKELVILDAASGNILNTVAIPNPYNAGVCSDDMVRPWALKVRGQDVYIGSVCEDQIENNVGAAIQKYNGAIFQTVAQGNTLRYLRPRGYGPTNKPQGDGYRYRNWTNNYADAPMLTDIEFTNSGDLVLGYNSRATYNRNGSLRGDVRKMCIQPNGTYVDEIVSADPDVPSSVCVPHVVTYSGNPTNYYEFYRGDFFGGAYGTGHPETASGALAQAPGAPNIIVGMIDGTDWWQPGAIGNYDNVSGDKIGAQAVINRNTISQGGEREPYGAKAGGMGDVELLCDPAPIEIGDLVWMDIDQDGIQDPNEPPMANVPVTLACDGNLIGTATTDANGHYYFGGPNNANLNPGESLTSGMNCTLSIAQSDVNGKPPTVTNPNGNADDTIDNDAVANGSNNEITFSTTAFNNHNLDFGITPAFGCVTGQLFQDNNGNGIQDGTDTVAPAGITVTITDAYGNSYTTQTDSSGQFSLNPIVVGNVTVSVDTTDTDIPDGAVWSAATTTVNVAEDTPPNCATATFPYALPAPVNQDPKDNAVCADATSLTWEGSNKSTATVWQDMLTNDLTNVTTAGGTTVQVSMHIDNPDNEFYDTDTANSSGSGTSAAFGQPYLTLYLGDQVNPGDGDYMNSDGQGCAAHGYDLEAGEKSVLTVTFDQEVVLDNWRIRDVDSGDIRSGVSDWEWQDGIKVEGFDADGNPVPIETKIGSSGVGLIVDNNDIVHSDPNSYVATNGNGWDNGDGVTANSTNGHIVLTSNFVPVKTIKITHLAGPDMPCQTRSALALSGFAVCVPLIIQGEVFNDEDGVAPAGTCGSSDNQVDGTLTGDADGIPLNACLLDSNGVVLDTQVVSDTTTVPGQYEFKRYIKPNTDYKVLLTTEDCTIGQAAPAATLPQGWHFEGEQIDPNTNNGHDGTPDGMIEVHVATATVSNVDFAINKEPEALDYTEPSRTNPGGSNTVTFNTSGNASTFYVDDYEQAMSTINILSVSNGTLYNGNTVLNPGDTIPVADLVSLTIDPIDGDIESTFTYKVLDNACRESNAAVFKAPFVDTGSWSGNVTEDTDNDDAGDQPIENVTIELYSDPNCDGNRSDGSVVDTTTTDANGDYQFTGVPHGCYVAVETQPSGYLDVTENDGGADNDALGNTPVNEISGTIDPGETDEHNDFVEEKPGSLCGSVTEDLDNDDAGDQPISGVTLSLYDTNGVAAGTTTTDASGNYCFSNLVPGDYTVKETQPNGYFDVTENEGGADNDQPDDGVLNSIKATVDPGETDSANDFVEEKPGSLCGNVSEDINQDDTGDIPIQGVTLTLSYANGMAAGTTTTDASGNYCFSNLVPGEYTVKEMQPATYTDVKENEGGDDNDTPDDGQVNSIKAYVLAGETDSGNDFVERKFAKITGNVTTVDHDGSNPKPLPGVTLVLFDLNDNEIARTVTDSNGHYEFTAPPGTYVIREIQPDSYYSYSENEGGADNDATHTVLNTLKVVLSAGEVDVQNDFVESKQSTAGSCCLCFCKSATPSGASITEDGAKVYWKAVENAQSYEIYVNGTFVTSVSKDAREYALSSLESDKDFTVEIVAIGPKGGKLKQTVKFKTPKIDTPWLPAILNMML